MGQRTSVYLDDGLAAAVKVSGVPLAELIRRGLGAAESRTAMRDTATVCGMAVPDSADQMRRSPDRFLLPDGEPSPGAVCATPSCWQKNVRKYGLRQLPLCDARAAALQSQDYKRKIPESAGGPAPTPTPVTIAVMILSPAISPGSQPLRCS